MSHRGHRGPQRSGEVRCAGSGERGGGFGFVEARGGSIFYGCVFVSDRGLDFCGVGRGVN